MDDTTTGDQSPPATPSLPPYLQQPAASAPAAPLREEEVQNAVNFLTHPKVVGSTAGTKRSFLKNKGLTDEEIDEGFNRVAKLPPVQLPATGVVEAPKASVVAAQAPVAPQFTWTRGILALSVLAAGAYGVGTLLAPWARKWWFGDQPDDNANDRVVAMLDAMSKKQEKLESTITGMAPDRVVAMLDAISEKQEKLEHAVSGIASSVQTLEEAKSFMQTSSAGPSFGSPEVMSKLAPRDLHAASPSSFGNDSTSHTGSAFRAYSSADRPLSASQDASAQGSTGPGQGKPQALQHPADYLQILRMLEQGQTPPGVRTDINDKPPFPNAEPTPSEVPRRPKPWELQSAAKPSSFASVTGGMASSELSGVHAAVAAPSPSTLDAEKGDEHDEGDKETLACDRDGTGDANEHEGA